MANNTEIYRTIGKVLRDLKLELEEQINDPKIYVAVGNLLKDLRSDLEDQIKSIPKHEPADLDPINSRLDGFDDKLEHQSEAQKANFNILHDKISDVNSSVFAVKSELEDEIKNIPEPVSLDPFNSRLDCFDAKLEENSKNIDKRFDYIYVNIDETVALVEKLKDKINNFEKFNKHVSDNLDQRLYKSAKDFNDSFNDKLKEFTSKIENYDTGYEFVASIVDKLAGKTEQHSTLIKEVDQGICRTMDDIEQLKYDLGETDDYIKHLSSRIQDKAEQVSFDSFKKEINQRVDDVDLSNISKLDYINEDVKGLQSDLSSFTEVFNESNKNTTDNFTKHDELFNVSFAEFDKVKSDIEKYKDVVDVVVNNHQKFVNEKISKDKQIIKNELSNNLEGKIANAEKSILLSTMEFIEEKLPSLKGEKGKRGKTGYLTVVKDYVKEFLFRSTELITHKGGVWQALVDTESEPDIDSEKWALVSNGISDIYVESLDDFKNRVFIEDSTGESVSFDVNLPTLNFKKTWDGKETYKKYDSVIENRCRWLAVKDNPQGKPSVSDDWLLYSMGGQQGRRGLPGEKGDKGDKGEPGESVSLALVLDSIREREELDTDGIPIRRWRGLWSYNKSYELGDVVSFDNSVALCLEAADGSTPPNKIGNQKWTYLLQLETGSTGGGSTDGVTTASGVATGDITSLNIVTSDFDPVDQGNINDVDKIIGIAVNDALTGVSVDVQFSGTLTDASWSWSSGNVFLGADSNLTQTAPTTGIYCIIGKAISATTIIVDIKQAVWRG